MLRINKLQIPNKRAYSLDKLGNYKFQILSSSGFSFVEILVVISIMGVLISITIASYSNFRESTILKNSALQLKSDLRFVQNKVLAGDKRIDDPTPTLRCPKADLNGRPLYTLVGWYLTITEGSDTYTINSSCRDANAPLASDQADSPIFKSFKLPQGVSVSDIDSSATSVQIFFRPLNYGVTFHSTSSPPFYASGNLQSEVVYTAPFEITLTSTSGNSYQVIIQPSGEISEKKL